MNINLYHPGDFVYFRDHSSKKGRSPKGPFLVIRSQHPVYGIQTRKKEKFVHHDDIKVCEDRQIPLWLRRARNRLWASESVINPSDIPIGGKPLWNHWMTQAMNDFGYTDLLLND